MAPPETDARRERKAEIAAFLFLTIILWPVLAIAVVGGWGFLVWMFQLIAGPPGPPTVT